MVISKTVFSFFFNLSKLKTLKLYKLKACKPFSWVNFVLRNSSNGFQETFPFETVSRGFETLVNILKPNHSNLQKWNEKNILAKYKMFSDWDR